ncbi:sugar ABC transporter permease [Cohnella sp. CIP 111063]|uniref:carbohydrate ABC transporter permease n=1 Tax=unclassified Cohnella TaxID=2636738 RepID=UPI000B8BE031|nr:MULTISPECIES: carbohydrate ABC transporter permease [unclassified Cohnella]OXS60473.1 sugar ABC transporter permease [Cohnella sp. CIP 111063]PRX73179.1 putative aldouronate transport system permease protein [Cohnella sp. SGD-V74]
MSSKNVQVLINAFFVVVCFLIAVPFLLVIAISVSSEESLYEYGYQFIPKEWSLEAYRIVFEKPDPLIKGYGVTILITVVGTAVSLFMTALMAYPISRRDFRYNRPVTFYVFFTMLFNGGLIPFYILMTQYLHLKNSLAALIIPAVMNPFNIMIMKGFLDKISMEIIESAKIDGAREFRIFFRIILPLSTPVLATLGLFIAFGYWNEWFNALLFIDNDKYIPLQLLLVRILSQAEFLANSPMAEVSDKLRFAQFPTLTVRMAMAIVASGPMLLVFPFFQKYFVKGITVGSLKG